MQIQSSATFSSLTPNASPDASNGVSAGAINREPRSGSQVDKGTRAVVNEPTKPGIEMQVQGAGKVTISAQAYEQLQVEQNGAQREESKIPSQLKDQLIAQQQNKQQAAGQTEEESKQEKIAEIKKEMRKIKEELRKLEHDNSEMAKKQKALLSLALTQLNTSMLDLLKDDI
ncbi:hypothetical protein [Motilimonas pumila]|nr:hypothetical protein [Motilimonas pumila]